MAKRREPNPKPYIPYGVAPVQGPPRPPKRLKDMDAAKDSLTEARACLQEAVTFLVKEDGNEAAIAFQAQAAALIEKVSALRNELSTYLLENGG